MIAGKKKYLVILFIVLSGILINLGSMNAPFYLDDDGNIINKASVRLEGISRDGLAIVFEDSRLTTRPVANFSFALNYYFFKYDVFWFRVVNVAIHILTATFLFLFLLQTFQTPALKNRYNEFFWIAAFASLLWLVHPVQTQAVTYIVQRMTSMCSMFYILSMLLYATGRLNQKNVVRWVCFGGSLLAALMAFGTKEISAMLPVMIVLYEWFFFQDCSKEFLKKILPVFAVIVILWAAFVFSFNENFLYDYILKGYESRDFTMPERLMTEARVILFYVSLLLFPYPSRLSLEHDFSVSNSLFEPFTTVSSVIAIMCAVVFACKYAHQYRLYSFGVFWFLGNLLIESSIIPLELIFEHRLYLPSMLVFIFIPAALLKLVQNKKAAVAMMLLLAVILGGWTYQRNSVWAKPLAFHQHNVKRAQNNHRSHYNLGHYYLSKGNFAEAIRHLSYALELEPRNMQGHKDLGFSYLMTRQYDKALFHYQKAAEAFPGEPKVFYYQGVIYRDLGDKKKAVEFFRTVLKKEPSHIMAHTNLGDLYAAQGMFDQAALHFSEVLRIGGEKNFMVLVNLGNCYANLGRYEGAMEYYAKALAINPGHERVRQNLELARQKLEASKREY